MYYKGSSLNWFESTNSIVNQAMIMYLNTQTKIKKQLSFTKININIFNGMVLRR